MCTRETLLLHLFPNTYYIYSNRHEKEKDQLKGQNDDLKFAADNMNVEKVINKRVCVTLLNTRSLALL